MSQKLLDFERVPLFKKWLRCLAWGLVIWTWGVAMLGAYVRLSDAGLGCPDWPGCYGYIYAPHQPKHLETAAIFFPDAPVDILKAWKEMAHRYAVAVLGIGIMVLLCALHWYQRQRRVSVISPFFSLWIIAWLIGQALFGMWTVTEKLTPWVVTVHLLGGMLLLAWLICVATSLSFQRHISPHLVKLKPLVAFVCFLVICQIALGGWVSTHYAAGVCGKTFPLCRGSWMPSVMNWKPVLELSHPLGYQLSGEIFPASALVAIHWLHRCGALCVSLAIGILGWKFLKTGEKFIAYLLWGILFIQVNIGVANVHLNLPIGLAVAHNGGAAVLLGVLVCLFRRLSTSSEEHQHASKDKDQMKCPMRLSV